MKHIKTLALATFALLFTYGCAAGGSSDGGLPLQFSDSVSKLAFESLAAVQDKSIGQDREYCGHIIRRQGGEVYATEALKGTSHTCRTPSQYSLVEFQDGDKVEATFHTHAGYDKRADSEVPSILDLVSIARGEIKGYVSTPGGRFWFIDPTGRFTVQICGVGCMQQDEDFVDEVGEFEVPNRLSFSELAARQGVPADVLRALKSELNL